MANRPGPARPEPPPPKFVIWAPPYSETWGGSIVLHLLCARLNERGERAFVWPSDKPYLSLRSPPRRFLEALSRYVRRRRDPFPLGPFANPVARRRDLRDAVVLYPEVVNGNPLGARHVVRWFLHRPGFHGGGRDYGKDELYFQILDVFNDPAINPRPSPRLEVMYVNPAYRDRGYPERSGSCYMMRKGEGRALVHDLSDSIRLDGLSHERIAEEMNRRERFYCYDPYTMFTQYAAICGCIPIVVPEAGKTSEDWQPDVTKRYGHAYGEDEIPWAVATRHLLLEAIARRRAEEDRMVDGFRERCRRWYGERTR